MQKLLNASIEGYASNIGGKGLPFATLLAVLTFTSEFAGAACLALGLFTRIAALIGSGQMAYAYFTEHQPQGVWPIQNGGELATLYCFAFLLIAFAGGGAFALQKHRS